MTHSDRIARFAAISTALELKSNQQLVQLVDKAPHRTTGIGGTTAIFEIEGMKVFAKSVRLTDLELLPENVGSTANLFQLPTHYHRNVGSAGFGAWRELAAHVMTTGWVLSRQLESVPMMYHWRVLRSATSASTSPLPRELAKMDYRVIYWGGSEAVRTRLAALGGATASVMIFLEYFPWNLSVWLEQQLAGSPEEIDSACKMVERDLSGDVSLMNALGLLHGDAHFANILTDGERLYFADFGLAISKRFELSVEEVSYQQVNASLDRAYVLANWINQLVKTWVPTIGIPKARNALVQAVANGQTPDTLIPDLPICVAKSIQCHAPVAAAINDFYARLRSESRSTPYPRAGIEATLRNSAGLHVV
jgi:hypothetical protein